MFDWLKNNALYTKNPLTGKMEGPYRGWQNDTPSGGIPTEVYVKNPFDTGFSGPTSGSIEVGGQYYFRIHRLVVAFPFCKFLAI